MALSARAKRTFAKNQKTAAKAGKVKATGADKLLTANEQAFVAAYVKSQSVLAAFRETFPGTLTRSGPQALSLKAHEVFRRPHVQRAIEMFEQAKIDQIREEERQRLVARHGRLAERVLTQDRVVAELHDVAYANIKDFITFDEEGRPKWHFQHASDRQMACISDLDVLVRNGQNGPEVRIKIKLHSKIAALKMLGDHLGMWPKDAGFSMPTGAGQTPETKSTAADNRAKLLEWLDRMAVPEPLAPVETLAAPVELPPEPPQEESDGEGAHLFPR